MRTQFWLMALLLFLGNTSRTLAHFPWLVPMNDSANRVQLFFGEGPQPDDPSYLARWLDVPVTPILGTKPQKPTAWKWNEAKDGLTCTVPGAGAWELTHTYGVLKRSESFLLVYSAKAVQCQPPETSDALRVRLPAQGLSVESLWDGKQLELVFFEDGKPAAHLEVHANTSEGSKQFATDESGRYRFETPVSGVVSFRVAKTIDRQGTWEGEEYTSVRHHTTFCVRVPRAPSATIVSQDTTTLPALPLALTSFGATRHASIGMSMEVIPVKPILMRMMSNAINSSPATPKNSFRGKRLPKDRVCKAMA